MYLLFLKEVTLEYFFIALLFAALPDLDIFLTPLKRVFKSNYLEHRGGSHSFVIGIIVSFFVGLIISPITQLAFLNVWLVGMLFYGLHVAMDLLTTTKIPFLYPISKKEVSFYVEKAGSSFTMLNSLLCLFLLSLFYNTPEDITIVLNLVNFFTFFFIGYYLLRITSKLVVKSKLTSKQKYFPGVLPFFFIIYEYENIDNIINLVLEKQSHFSKRSVIYRKTITLDTTEMEIFGKALSICKGTYYFAKWTLLPALIRTEGILSIRFYFLEPMVHKRAVYVQYNFDLTSQEVIRVKQYYGAFLD